MKGERREGRESMKSKYKLGGLTLLAISMILICGCHKINRDIVPQSVSEGQTSAPETSVENIEGERNIHSGTAIAICSSTAIAFPNRIDCADGSALQILKYPDGILGNDTDMLQGCQAGTVSAFIGSPTVSIQQVPELALLSIPYLVSDPDKYQNILRGRLKEWFQPFYQSHGLQLLAWTTSYKGCLLSCIPIHSPEDVSKLNVRTMLNPYREEYWSAVGAHPLSLSYDEIGYYLQTKQLNAVEAGLAAMSRSGYIKYFHYYCPIDHIPALVSMVMNKEEYDRLTPEQQSAMSEYAEKAVGHADIAQQYINRYQLEITEPDEELKNLLYSKRKIVIDRLQENLGAELVNQFFYVIQSEIQKPEIAK